MMTSLFSLSPVLGYLDPGTGSFLLQIMIAGMLSGAYVVGQSWHWVKAKALSPLRKQS